MCPSESKCLISSVCSIIKLLNLEPQTEASGPLTGTARNGPHSSRALGALRALGVMCFVPKILLVFCLYPLVI